MIFVFSIGTLGYVMSEVEAGKPLSEVVKAAKSLGYTEPGSPIILSRQLVSMWIDGRFNPLTND